MIYKKKHLQRKNCKCLILLYVVLTPPLIKADFYTNLSKGGTALPWLTGGTAFPWLTGGIAHRG